MEASSTIKNENHYQTSEEKTLAIKHYYSILYLLFLSLMFSVGMTLLSFLFSNPTVNPIHSLLLRIFSLTAIGLSLLSVVLYITPLGIYVFITRRKTPTSDIFAEILEKQANASTTFYRFRTNSIVFAVLLSFVLVISSMIYSIVLSFL